MEFNDARPLPESGFLNVWNSGPSHKKGGIPMQIEWLENFDSALSDAKRAHKHVLLDFYNPL